MYQPAGELWLRKNLCTVGVWVAMLWAVNASWSVVSDISYGLKKKAKDRIVSEKCTKTYNNSKVGSESFSLIKNLYFMIYASGQDQNWSSV